jgi:hypothetical protein
MWEKTLATTDDVGLTKNLAFYVYTPALSPFATCYFALFVRICHHKYHCYKSARFDKFSSYVLQCYDVSLNIIYVTSPGLVFSLLGR